MAYALEYNDEKGIFLFTCLLVGKNQQSFDLEGDSGSLILLTGQNGEKPRPMGIIWRGTANRGQLKLRSGNGPENWTIGVDLGRLLDLLQLNLITTDEGLQEAMQEQRSASATIVGSTAGESSPEEGTLPKDKTREIYEPMGLNIQQLHMEGASGIGLSPPFTHANFHVNGVNTVNVWSISSFPTFLECHRCIKTMATTLNQTTSTP